MRAITPKDSHFPTQSRRQQTGALDAVEPDTLLVRLGGFFGLRRKRKRAAKPLQEGEKHAVTVVESYIAFVQELSPSYFVRFRFTSGEDEGRNVPGDTAIEYRSVPPLGNAMKVAQLRDKLKLAYAGQLPVTVELWDRQSKETVGSQAQLGKLRKRAEEELRKSQDN